jgi:hypothetical protein
LPAEVPNLQTARDYAALAVIPIQRYVSQYGTGSVGVWPDVTPFTANLTSDSVSAPILVGFGGWLPFTFLFAGQNAAGASRIYAVPA